MPDQPVSSTSPQQPTAPDELNLVDPAPDRPRLKRRNLKPRPSDSSSDPLPDSPRAEHPPTETPAPASSSTPASSYSLPTTPLYYTTGVPKAKEEATTMKTNPISSSSASSASARPASSTPMSSTTASSSSQPRPTTSASAGSSYQQGRPAASSASSASSSNPASRPAVSASSIPSGAFSASTGASPRPTAASAGSTASSSTSARPAGSTISAPPRASSVSDFRSNAERQAREQKSIGGIIAIVVYVLVGFFVLATILAGYGAYAITRQIHKQSLTLSDLDNRYTAETQKLSDQLQATNASLARSNAQIARQQELLAIQQQNLTKLSNAADANVAAWRTERQTRAAETASLRARVRDLEDQPHFGPANH